MPADSSEGRRCAKCAASMFASVTTGAGFYLSERHRRVLGETEQHWLQGAPESCSSQDDLSATSPCLMESRKGNDLFLYHHIRWICRGLTGPSSALTPGPRYYVGCRPSLVLRTQLLKAAEDSKPVFGV